MVEKELSYFSVVNFLLSDEVKLLAEATPGILGRLSHSSQGSNLDKGLVKGNKKCILIVKKRLPRFNQTIFVCRPPPGIYNLPENQLLKFTLRKIQILIEEILSSLNVRERNRFEEFINKEGKEKWDERLAWLNYHIGAALKNIYLAEVDSPSQVTESMLISARRARVKDYELAEECYNLYEWLIMGRDKEELKSIIEESIAVYRVSDV